METWASLDEVFATTSRRCTDQERQYERDSKNDRTGNEMVTRHDQSVVGVKVVNKAQ